MGLSMTPDLLRLRHQLVYAHALTVGLLTYRAWMRGWWCGAWRLTRAWSRANLRGWSDAYLR